MTIRDPLRIIVTGMIGQQPVAGQTCHYLQYVLGLRDLGHDVYYIEDGGAPPYHPQREMVDADWSYTLPYLSRTMSRFGLEGRWAYYVADEDWVGLSGAQVNELWRTADVLLNVSGCTWLNEVHRQVPARAFIDTDPHVTHVAAAGSGSGPAPRLKTHTHHFTFALNVASPDCRLPPSQIRWQPTCQPIHLPMWVPQDGLPAPSTAYTTVTSWAPYVPVKWQGQELGGKEGEFRRFVELASKLTHPVDVALACSDTAWAPISEWLRDEGWGVRDAWPVTQNLDTYTDFISQSFASLSIAKQGYVATRSGWFSERDACYLACGRPVLAQDTGFAAQLPIGDGLLSFDSEEAAIAADARLSAHWLHHARAARRIAEECFDARRVLTALLEACTTTQERPTSHIQEATHA